MKYITDITMPQQSMTLIWQKVSVNNGQLLLQNLKADEPYIVCITDTTLSGTVYEHSSSKDVNEPLPFTLANVDLPEKTSLTRMDTAEGSPSKSLTVLPVREKKGSVKIAAAVTSDYDVHGVITSTMYNMWKKTLQDCTIVFNKVPMRLVQAM